MDKKTKRMVGYIRLFEIASTNPKLAEVMANNVMVVGSDLEILFCYKNSKFQNAKKLVDSLARRISAQEIDISILNKWAKNSNGDIQELYRILTQKIANYSAIPDAEKEVLEFFK